MRYRGRMTATTTTEDPTTPDASDASTFDVNEFLNRLDAVFASHSATTKAEPLLLDAMTDAENPPPTTPQPRTLPTPPRLTSTSS